MDEAGLGSSVEAEVWELFDADEAVADETVYLVAAALQGDEALAEQLGGDAPTPVRPSTDVPEDAEPLRAFLRSITVEGFRGIGPRATLELNPYCGITVISGRNGSGKSSFAEALEYALTGQSYRWLKKKGQHWESSWRNLHHGEPAAITVEFAMETDSGRSGSTATVGVKWDPGAVLGAAKHWSQVKGQKREPLAAIGWDQALVTHRPLMSYDELGGLLEEGPSNLYDALNRLLGLDEIADADSRLKDAEKRLGGPRKAANDARTQLVRALDASTDPRAAEVKKLVARKPYDLDAVTATTLGTATDQATTIAQLRDDRSAGTTGRSQGRPVVANELRAAIDAHATSAGPAVKAITARAALLREALHLHADIGEGPCPVCETGTLDAAWRAAAEERLKEADATTAEHQAVVQRLTRARAAAEGFFRPLAAVAAVAGVELVSLGDYNDALTRARSAPASLSDLPAHLESATAALDAAAHRATRRGAGTCR